jgi:SnoaL-like domain
MKRLAELVVAAAVVTIAVTASAQTLTEAQARAVITPWYVLFNQPVQGDMRALQEQILTADYESCWGYLPGECWGREASIKVVGGFAKSIPDMKFEIKEVLVAGDRVIVRGEVSGTPAISSVCRIRARAFGSWRSTSRPSETARSLAHITSRTGSVRWDSFAQSSEFVRSGENGNDVADSAGSATPNPPFRHGSRRRPRMSVEPDGLASSSSISQTIGGGHEIWHDRRRRCRVRIRARGAGQGP